MNIHERANFVRAMDTIVRAINDESYLNIWLSLGVADGDVDGTETDEELEFYVDDDAEFAELMDLFLYVIKWTPDSPFASIGKRFAITQLRISPKPFVFVMTEFRNSIASPFIWNIYS